MPNRAFPTLQPQPFSTKLVSARTEALAILGRMIVVLAGTELEWRTRNSNLQACCLG